MHTKRLLKILVLVVLALSLAGVGLAQNVPVTPKHKSDGSKFRVAYIQGGPYFEYDQVFLAVILQLRRLGWLESTSIQPLPIIETIEQYTFLKSQGSAIPSLNKFHPEYFTFRELPELERETFIRKQIPEAIAEFQKMLED